MIIQYRRDIDGLRTIAVLPVLFFHAGVPGVDGGFVGVDVFFVISGYLITSIIAREIADGCFSIVNFYERRIRRILPALVAVMAAVMAGIALLYFPSDFRQVPKTVLAALLFCSNILFYFDSNYFATAAHTKPMLHTWSLAVEEQFYIIFPLFLMLMHRFAPRWRTAAIWGIAAVSLAMSIVMVWKQPSFAFYMLPTRAWELMAGALLAVGAIPAVTNRAAREVLATGGLAVIGWAVLTFSSATPFPGAAALFPVIGSAILIHVAPGTLVGRLLGLPPMVFVGLISYSLYLWHWPVVVFAEYATDASLEGWRTVGVIVVSLLLATFSWWFIERPFRSRLGVPRRRLFKIAAAASVGVCLVAGAAQASRGWPSRFDAGVLALEGAARDFSPKRKSCHWDEGEGLPERAPCTLGGNVPPSAALWGDSHGVELSYALGEAAAKRGASITELTSSSCPPVIGVSVPDREDCRRRNDAVLEWLRAHPGIKTVVLVGYWANPSNAPITGLAAGLERTADALVREGRHVVLVGAVPPNSFQVPRYLAHLAQRGALGEAQGMTRAELARRTAYLAPTFARLRTKGVTVVEPRDSLCNARFCDNYRGGKALYFDSHHLSLAGAGLVVTGIDAAVAGAQ